MALTLPMLSPIPAHFLPIKTLTPKPKPLAITSSFAPKPIPSPPLDRHATAHNHLRFVTKLTTLLLSKPHHFLPVKILARCRSYLSLPPNRPLLPFIHRYPTIFTLSHDPSSSLLCVSLTPSALSLFRRRSLLRSHLSLQLASKLTHLLLISSHSQLLLSKLVHIAPDLGLPPNFRSSLCNSHPHLFHTLDTSYGRAVKLTSLPSPLPQPFPVIREAETEKENSIARPIIDRPNKFKKLRLRRGLNLKRRHLEYLIRFQGIPDVNPYERKLEEGMSAEEKEKRACAVVREVLGMTVEKRTLVDHLTHFRKEFGLPNKLRGMLVRHPEMFYVSVKGQRDSVFLVEAYDDKGRLVVEDELAGERARLEELVREGKRMRRERRRGVGLMGEENVEEEEEEDDGDDYDDDGFGDLFESGIGDDWEEFGGGDGGQVEKTEIVEFWSMKGESEPSGGSEGDGARIEAW